ncbi:hypothetical protein [Paenibacillus sp. ISL-20]|uniref:hypothetical protein n=1 Tax=Paenibacillus sp. ISL-20 TaxID=2819163 RepID=UPI001BEA13AE|nr:hypothetical protein [Paenibacillus sp. ISL-20]MBT2762090.1 hypothetical protein [Paenibacillus sp. ISL-20]
MYEMVPTIAVAPKFLGMVLSKDEMRGAMASADACPESIRPLRYAVQISYFFRRKETVLW